MSLINLLACLAYGMVGVLAIGAGSAALASDRNRAHLVTWLICALVFALMIASRTLGWEEAAREALRAGLAENDFVNRRQYLQKPLVAVAIMAGAVILWVGWAYANSARSRPSDLYIRLVQLLMGLLVPLFALRIISLHAFDRLLYGGSIRLNWVLDGGITIAAGALAALYIVRQRQRINDRIRPS
ncbi:hypothetical protein [Aurantiacibacter marinus]|uniref:Uncharacterized protein n=1 Tax=Aurantiacibacter marinus TaxID=874156 RepID=A0A0H0XRR3_9SPHN|nr:hypothetical protein [Aurantiacibacter marinus]KLI64642.1 hypothetical protein AAV99_03565 [Aurantiacibacter marinus]